MRFTINRRNITIVPECDEDIAYIEDTMGLKHGGDAVALVREDCFGLSCIAYLATASFSKKPVKLIDAELDRLRSKLADSESQVAGLVNTIWDAKAIIKRAGAWSDYCTDKLGAPDRTKEE